MQKTFTTLLLAVFIACACANSAFAQPDSGIALSDAALKIQNPLILYRSGYTKIPYPNGDVPESYGVCSDVVIRAYREVGVDLQQLVHEDMRKNFDKYPKLWGLTNPDPNIDHRRVPNLRVFFSRKGTVLPSSRNPDDYKPGDIVTWNLRNKGSLPHIGIVTDQRSADGKRPKIVHNIGYGQNLDDMLFDYKITGHYRYGLQ
jgi:uncharacterized protein YijF (DUF1287 family)